MVVISSDRSLSIIYMRSRMAPSLELIQSFSIDTQTRTHSLSCRALLCPALPCTSSAIDPVVVLLTTIKTPPHNRWPFTNKKEPSVLCLQLGSPSVFFFFSFLSHDQLLTQPAATNGWCSSSFYLYSKITAADLSVGLVSQLWWLDECKPISFSLYSSGSFDFERGSFETPSFPLSVDWSL